jgi:hypothetical protein
MSVPSQMSNFFSEKLVQISLISGVLFYIVAHPVVFNMVEKVLRKVLSVVGVNVSLKGDKQVMFHALVFAILMGFSVKYIFSPVVNYMGANNVLSNIGTEGFDKDAYAAAKKEEEERLKKKP